MLKNPPLLTVRRVWQRPDAFTLGRLKDVQTGQAVDAMQGRGALDSAIKAVDIGNATFLGTALPCETGPNDNLAILAAISLAQPGDVIMTASEGFTQSAVVGDNVALVAKAKGVTAIVIGVGGFLGIGEKEVSMTPDQVKRMVHSDGETYFTVNTTKEQLQAAPDYVRPAKQAAQPTR